MEAPGVWQSSFLNWRGTFASLNEIFCDYLFVIEHMDLSSKDGKEKRTRSEEEDVNYWQAAAQPDVQAVRFPRGPHGVRRLDRQIRH